MRSGGRCARRCRCLSSPTIPGSRLSPRGSETRTSWTTSSDAGRASWVDTTSPSCFRERGVPAGPVLDCGADAYDDPHLQDREYFQVVDHPDAGTHLLSGQIWKMKNRHEVRHEPAPGLGQHNRHILGDLVGISSESLDEMEREQVIGTVPLPGADMGGVRRARAQGIVQPE